MKRYCFESNKFKIIKDEDENTNLGVYGLEFAKWLEAELNILGYEIEDVIPEDWGWCVICQSEPFLLWIGCQNDFKDDKLIWCCFVEAKKPIFRNPFKKLDIKKSLDNLNNDLVQLLNGNFSIITYDETFP